MGIKSEIIGSQLDRLVHPSDHSSGSDYELGLKILRDPQGIEAVANLFDLHISEGALEKTIEHLKGGKNRDVEVVANHGFHGDLLSIARPLGYIAEEVQEALPDFKWYMVVAKSLINGQQGEEKKSFYVATLPFFEKHHILPLYIKRKEDDEKYGAVETTEEEEEEERQAAVKLALAYRNGYGTILFPEGTTKGGKLKRDINDEIVVPHRINGLQTPSEELGRYFAFKILKSNPLILPVGLINSNKILDPDTAKITKGAKNATIQNIFAPSLQRKIATANIGDPFVINELPPEILNYLQNASRNHEYHVIKDYIMIQIAAQLPEFAWGSYREIMESI